MCYLKYSLRIFLFHRKVMFSSQDIQVFVFLVILWFSKSVMSWWVLVHETRCIFEYIFWIYLWWWWVVVVVGGGGWWWWREVIHMWYAVQFGISHCLAFVWSFECMRMHANTFLYHVISICLYELAWHSNGSMKFQMLECQSNRLGV